MKTLIAGLFAVFCGLPVPGQNAGARHVTVLRAARMLDVAGGRVVSPGLVVVDGERIVSVGGAAPAGGEVLDLGDVTLMPGMIDAHVHLFLHPERKTCRPCRRAWRSGR